MGIVFVGLFALTVLLIIFLVDKPKWRGPKITGRGGDFE